MFVVRSAYHSTSINISGIKGDFGITSDQQFPCETISYNGDTYIISASGTLDATVTLKVIF